MSSLTDIIGESPQSWISSRTGPIVRFWGAMLAPPEPKWWIFGAELARAPRGTYWSAADFSAAGASINRKEALTRALGETIERHASLNSLDEDTEVLSARSEQSVSARFAVCAATEDCPPMFKGQNWDRPVGHVRMTRLVDSEHVLVPTPYVHLGYPLRDRETTSTFPISTGTAFAATWHAAVWRGLCEVIERDAIMLAWLSQSGFSRVELTDSGPDALTARVQRLRDSALRLAVYDITSDVNIPTVLAVVEQDEYPFTTVGASCQADPLAACAKAIDEAVSVRFSLQQERWRQDIPDLTSFAWVRRLEDHMALYGNWRNSPALAILANAPTKSMSEWASQEWIEEPIDGRELRHIADYLYRSSGLTVLVATLQCQDATRWGHVVRVVIPEAVPLSQDHNARWLATPRLVSRMDAKSTSVNFYPHPFA